MRKSLVSLVIAGLVLTGCTYEQKRHGAFLDLTNEVYELAEYWFLSNIRDKGLFVYKYHPKVDDYPSENNAIRQLMGARLLAELALEKPELEEVHKKNIDFYMEHWYEQRGELGYVYFSDKSKLGANGTLLRALVWSPFFEEYEEEAQRLAYAIISQIQPDGSFNDAFLIPPEYNYDSDYLLTFYSGEALVALAEYYIKTKDEFVLEQALKAQDFYVRHYVDRIRENYYPAYIPWHTISLNYFLKITKDPKYERAIYIINNELLLIHDKVDVIGRFYRPEYKEYGSPHSSSDGVYTEGLAYAYEVARMTGNEIHQELYLDALRLAVHNLATLQYTEENIKQYGYERPERAVGGLKYSKDRSGVRIDTVQHAMDALRKIQIIFGEREPVKFAEDWEY